MRNFLFRCAMSHRITYSAAVIAWIVGFTVAWRSGVGFPASIVVANLATIAVLATSIALIS